MTFPSNIDVSKYGNKAFKEVLISVRLGLNSSKSELRNLKNISGNVGK